MTIIIMKSDHDNDGTEWGGVLKALTCVLLMVLQSDYNQNIKKGGSELSVLK